MPDLSEQYSFDVYLCHSSKDKDVVREIAKRLRADGLRVWFDEWVLKPGDSIPVKVEDGLENSRVLVLCMSANAFGSDWAKLEAGTFRFRDPLNNDRRFIPLRLDDAAIKNSLAQFLFIDWREEGREQEFAKLLDSIRPPVSLPAVEAEPVGQIVPEKAIRLDIHATIWSYVFSPDGRRAITGASDQTIRLWDLETGLCLRTFHGHSGTVWTVAWSADSRRALSGSEDNTVRLWDIETGLCLRVLEGHTASVRSVAWSVDQKYALSGSADKTMRLWDIQAGRCVHVFKGHTNWVSRLAWSSDQGRALSCGYDTTIRLWEMETGICLRTLVGHSDEVWCVAWNSDERFALSGSNDNTVRLWDVETGTCIGVLTGHTDWVRSVAWSTDERYALSGSDDNQVRLWHVESSSCRRILIGHLGNVRCVAWSLDNRRAFSGDSKGEIRIWDLSEFVPTVLLQTPSLVDLPAPDQVQYTNAKVLLVGDTGVGKSGLAKRLVQKQFALTRSSHARKAYVLESRDVTELGGITVHQETVLWDLAGQPAYRLVHQLSMEEATVACVLFDSRNETNPFEGATYWSQVLDQARTSTRLKKILVASRIDVGGMPASREAIDAFVSANGFDGFIPTSAKTGEGCEHLLAAIRNGIPWDQLPIVTTTRTFAALRDFVAQNRAGSASLFTVGELHNGFVASQSEHIPLDEFVSHLQRLEVGGHITLLVFKTVGSVPREEDLVLLDPTRVDAYASALLVAARDEPDGPGHLLEMRVREAKFKIDPEERLADSESEKNVLWFVMESLLELDLALREQIQGEQYFVFPSQCTAELMFSDALVFGVALSLKGVVRSVYATLIAQLAHFEEFKNRQFYRDAASFRPVDGGRCIVRLRDQGDGQGELELSFEAGTSVSVRQGFIKFVKEHLESKCKLGSVTSRHTYRCSSCHWLFDDSIVKVRLADRKRDLVCPVCEKRTLIVDLLTSSTAEADLVAARIVTDAQVGRRRMTASLVVSAKAAQGKFDVFLSHNSKDKMLVESLAKRLLAVGIRPWLDKWNLPPGDTVSDALERAIKTVPCSVLCFGPADVGRWHITEIRAYIERWASRGAWMIPVILPGIKKTPELPLFVR